LIEIADNPVLSNTTHGSYLAKLGELLRDMPKAKTEGLLRGTRAEPRGIATYRDLGLDKKTASVAQQLAGCTDLMPLDMRVYTCVSYRR
jgi:hypothetical protein